MRRPVLAAAHSVIVMCGVLTGVSACVHSSAGQQPPIVICGTTVYGGGSEAFVYDVAQGGTITGPSPAGTVIISVSSSCDQGSHVTWTPASAARLVQSAYAKDGLLAAVALQPASQDAVFTVTATQDGKLVGTVTYDPAS
jgi:hypothetical protein